MKTKLLAGLLMVAGAAFADSRFSVGVQFGSGPGYGSYQGGYRQGYLQPPPPPRGYAYRPPAPGRGFVFVQGYWFPRGNGWAWQEGYWTRPPQGRGRWNAPQFRSGRYYDGYWR